MEILCTKGPAGALLPMDEEQAEKVGKLKAGEVLKVDVAQMRNGRFFRKWWVLAKFAYDIWSETIPRITHRGQLVQANFNRFRKDLIILAGYYQPVFNAQSEMRLEAESISWAKMDEEAFEKLYSATINAVLQKVLNNPKLSEAQVRAHVDRALQFG
jgi:hypothetical protein